MNLILSVKELNRTLHDSNFSGKTIIVDTRPLPDYLDGHIPGAINIDLMQFHWFDTSGIGIRQFNRQMTIYQALLHHEGYGYHTIFHS